MSNISFNSTLDTAKNLIIKQSLSPSESSFLFYFKLFSFAIILIITFSFGLLPIFFAKYRQTTILNYANPFAGGIFIGIGLFHLLPDASFDFEQYYNSKEGSTVFFKGFPMSYFIAFLNDEKKSENDLNINNVEEKKENKLDDEIYEPLLKDENDNNINKNNNENNIEILDKEEENEKINNSLMFKRNKGKFKIYLI